MEKVGRKVRIRERFEDAMLPTLKIEEVAVSPGMQKLASKSGKRQGNGFSSRASRGSTVLPELEFETHFQPLISRTIR